ncbi:MAG: hypothetical protein AB7F99_00980 [Vicinamibacterales bacterium]
MQRDAAAVIDSPENDEGQVTLSDTVIAIGWTITGSLIGFFLVGLLVMYTI